VGVIGRELAWRGGGICYRHQQRDFASLVVTFRIQDGGCLRLRQIGEVCTDHTWIESCHEQGRETLDTPAHRRECKTLRQTREREERRGEERRRGGREEEEEGRSGLPQHRFGPEPNQSNQSSNQPVRQSINQSINQSRAPGRGAPYYLHWGGTSEMSMLSQVPSIHPANYSWRG
jgi:hypothetical protein